MGDRGWENPSEQDPAHTNGAADGHPTPGKNRPWSEEAPGSPEWDETGNDGERRADADRERTASGDGRHGTQPGPTEHTEGDGTG